MRIALSRVPKQKAQMVAAAIKMRFAQPDPALIHHQLGAVADTLSFSTADVSSMLEEAKADLWAFSSFPMAHRAA